MLFALARGSSKRLPADPCPVRMGEGALGGSWRTPLDGGPLVPQALLPWHIAGAADLMRRGFWHCALLAARPAPVIAFCALLRLAWKSSRHSYTSFIVASRLRHTHISGLPVGGVGRTATRTAGCGPPWRATRQSLELPMRSDEKPCGRHVRCGAQLRRTERIGAVTTSTLYRRSPTKYGRGWCRRNLSSQWWGHRAAPLVVRNSDALTTQVMQGHGKWVGITRATNFGCGLHLPRAPGVPDV
jgi:hypothetical protein